MRSLGFTCLTLLLLGASAVQAREFVDDFVGIKAGVVNYVEGRPTVFEPLGREARSLTARTQMRVGERIVTKAGERLEMLLNPGSYLRLGAESEMRVLGTNFEAMKFELLQGNLIVESANYNSKVHEITITTPEGDVVLLKSGLYRIEAGASGTQVLVNKGRARWIKDGRKVADLKSGKRFRLDSTDASGHPQYSKISKDRDDLDRWSRRRAEFLVAANERLSPWMMGSFSQMYPYRLRGGWLYNPYFNCYTFLPFDGIFGSPYGFSYGLFYPVRTRFYRYNPGWGSGPTYGSSTPTSRSVGVQQRRTVTSAPSAPAPRGDAGRSDQNSRAGAFGRMQRR